MSKRGIAILREMALVKGAVIDEQLKVRMLAALEEELSAVLGHAPSIPASSEGLPGAPLHEGLRPPKGAPLKTA